MPGCTLYVQSGIMGFEVLTMFDLVIIGIIIACLLVGWGYCYLLERNADIEGDKFHE